jgi:hypothetical protein
MYFIPPTTNFIQNFLITGAGLALLIAITAGYTRLIRPAVGRMDLAPRLKLIFSKA